MLCLTCLFSPLGAMQGGPAAFPGGKDPAPAIISRPAPKQHARSDCQGHPASYLVTTQSLRWSSLSELDNSPPEDGLAIVVVVSVVCIVVVAP